MCRIECPIQTTYISVDTFITVILYVNCIMCSICVNVLIFLQSILYQWCSYVHRQIFKCQTSRDQSVRAGANLP